MIAEVVRDDVVELARDPGALLGDGELGLLLALVLELDGARGERLASSWRLRTTVAAPQTANRMPPMNSPSPTGSSPSESAIVTTASAMIAAAMRPSRRSV